MTTITGNYTISAGSSSLLTDLVAFWKLEEASGTRVDSVGNNDLSDNNTVTQAAGIVGNAAQVTAVNNEWLSISDNTDLSTGDIDLTVAFWVYTTDGGPIRIGKFHYPTNNREWYWTWPGTNTVGSFVVSSNGTAETSRITRNWLPNTGWCLIICWHDSVNNLLGISVNNAEEETTPYSSGIFDSSADFNLGFIEGLGYSNGRIDAVGFWKRVLTADERTALYNAGFGIEYPF